MLSGAVREFGAEMQMRWLTDPGGRIAAYCVADISERALRADLNCGTESYVGRIVSVYRHMTGSRGFVSR
jgi:hypothetical protein